ncbi:MAG: tetratricopeptide repeat protein [Bacteroidales bacterium]|nr:tetratricopeptide repeat protein [Bacteroidales bacterium]
MKRVIFLTILLVPALVMAQSAKQYCKAGDEFMEKGNVEDAIVQYTKAIDSDPDYDKAYMLRAVAYEKLDKLDEALQDYNRASVFNENDAEILCNSGRILFLMGKYQDALEKLDKSIEAKKTPDAYTYKVKTLIELENYNEAQKAAEKILSIKEDEQTLFIYALVCEKLKLYEEAEKFYKKSIQKNKKFLDAYLAMANVKVSLNKNDEGMEYANQAVELEPQNIEPYVVRSHVYKAKLDYPSAINDVSKALVIKPESERLFMIRGLYYQEFNQHQNAINDFNKVILLNDKNAEAYYKRAWSYEQIANYVKAIKDYETIASLSEFDPKAQLLLKEAQDRLFELNRESNKPVIKLTTPKEVKALSVQLPKNKDEFSLKGIIADESDLKYLKVDNKDVPFVKADDGYEFMANVRLERPDTFVMSVSDVYDNVLNAMYLIQRTEINNPIVKIIAPYASDNGEIYLDNDDPNVYIEGKVEDESKIQSIMIEGTSASYKMDEMNPTFSATLAVTNKNKITVTATDEYGNKIDAVFKLNREAAQLAADNPMGKTWVIFIENSKYESFASLEGPGKDVSMIKAALANYQIHNFIHKKDLTKKEMERFFSIELRDMVRSNRVNSLLVWYAGHGKFVNETGYWIPVDAKRDDEFTYFNINSLKAAMQSYSNIITHTLVVTDACESGPSFYQAMRSTPKARSCNDWQATKFKSSQVFSSAGYELAVDNSQFTKTFANILSNNPNSCIPIEEVVNKVSSAVEKNNQQKPKFGKIAGLEDEDGTFFFISKE